MNVATLPGLELEHGDGLASLDRLILETRTKMDDPHRATDISFRNAQRAELSRLKRKRADFINAGQSELTL